MTKNKIIEGIKNKTISFDSLDKIHQADKEIAFIAVEEYGWNLEYVSKELQNNKELVVKAVQFDGWILEFVLDKFKKDKEVVLSAIKNDRLALLFASKEIQSEIEKIGENNAIAYLETCLKNKS